MSPTERLSRPPSCIGYLVMQEEHWSHESIPTLELSVAASMSPPIDCERRVLSAGQYGPEISSPSALVATVHSVPRWVTTVGRPVEAASVLSPVSGSGDLPWSLTGGALSTNRIPISLCA